MEKKITIAPLVFLALVAGMYGCKPKNAGSAISGDAAAKAYVAPGKYDEYYNFVSGGFSGQMSVYGLPSGRLLRVIPVFSVDPEKGWGYSEETKPMLNTSHGMPTIHPVLPVLISALSVQQKSLSCPTVRVITPLLLLQKIPSM
jgi:hypothetical protein